MAHYWGTLSSVVLPIIIVCVFGAAMQKWKPVETKTLADVSLYILAPCLVIIVLANSHLQGKNIASIFWFTIIQTACCWLLAKIVVKVFKFAPRQSSALTLTTIFGNANNYGLPVLLLAYGAVGLVNGAAYVIGQIVLINSLGLYIASRSNVSAKQALLRIIKTPLIYAVILGSALYIFHVLVPKGVASGLHLLGDSYPAIVLLILGMQLGKVRYKGMKRKEVWLSVGLRLLIVPIISKLCIILLGIKGVLASILFVQSSMPAAVNTIVFSNLYGSDDEMVTLTVAITTVTSFVTLPLLILYS